MSEDLKFNDIVQKLEEIHNQFPDLRFGHVIQAAIDRFKNLANVDLHDYSSKNFLSALTEFQRKTRQDRGV